MMSGVVWKRARRCQKMLLLGAFDQMRGKSLLEICFEAFDGQFIQKMHQMYGSDCDQATHSPRRDWGLPPSLGSTAGTGD